ncbi:cell envelope integrity protein TolA [Jiella mangrovi]|uniref:Cell envelope integrity protein TolA n=1 Tax=Jiella mangrovi TaxID=2821407 RepID=A0ABS4BBT4_9HYPH|nr:cell envelope integrity protein TolA [Jiella mangrovi]MBP0614216.1 cell envelope integrity protein TolA [Jiella mangrovi]
MRAGLVVSAVLHAAVLTWGLWSLSAPEPLQVAAVDSLPVELVPVEEYSQSLVGQKEAPVTDTPAPEPTARPETPEPAQNVGDNSVDLETPPTPNEREKPVEQTAAPAAAEPPPSPEAPPEPVPDPEVVPTPRPEPAPQPAEAAAPAEPAPSEPEPEESDPIEEAIASAQSQSTPEPKPEEQPAPKPEQQEVASLPDSGPVPQTRTSPPQLQRSETKKPDKPVEKPRQPAEEESQFDPDQIAALLNKEKSAGGGAKRSQQQASLGGQRNTGAKLSQSEMDALRGQVSQCWSPPAGVSEAGSLRVTIQMRLDPSGGLEGRPVLVDGGNGSTIERAAGEAALRAVIRCAPYRLPPEKYDTWSEVILNFDPSQML